MQRRKFVIGLGALASGTAAAVGTGAFSSVNAERNMEIEVDSDSEAYLGLESAGDNPNVGEDDDGRLYIDFEEGFNPDAVTEFDPLLTMTNRGSSTVLPDISLEVVSGENIADSLEFYAKGTFTWRGIGPITDPAFTGAEAVDRGTFPVDSGESVDFGLKVDLTDETGAMVPELSDEVEVVVTFSAEEDD